MSIPNENSRASETAAMNMCTADAYQDRKLFVHNLGELLSQARERVVCAYLDDNDQVHVQYRSSHEKVINVACDSYLAIVRDVTKNL